MNYYNPTNPYIYQGPQMPVVNQQAQQIQNGGLVNVSNEAEARSYPVAPGNSVTFKDDSAAYIYVKTMGFSQLDAPVFKKFKLIEEPDPEETPDELETLKAEMKKLSNKVDTIKKSLSMLMEDKDE